MGNTKFQIYFKLVTSFLLTFVSLFGRNLLGDMLDLQKQFDSLDGRYSCLGDSGGHPTSYEILKEGHGVGERGFHC